ncbi:MAG: hypothetical protein LQ341_004393 [Variospora aurantia]|nr:MAG: hypothetical protein LQ341_004393 [Variospora aurantia]
MSSERDQNNQGDNYQGADRGFLSDLATSTVGGKHNKPHQGQAGGIGGLASSFLGGQGSHGSGGHGGVGGIAGQLVGGLLGGGKPHNQQPSQSTQHSSASGGYGNPSGGHQSGGLGSFFGGHHGSSVCTTVQTSPFTRLGANIPLAAAESRFRLHERRPQLKRWRWLLGSSPSNIIPTILPATIEPVRRREQRRPTAA